MLQSKTLKTITFTLLTLTLMTTAACSTNGNSNEGFTTTDSGLQYKDVLVGDGETAESGQTVSVHYTGTFEDGSKFDSSRDRDQAFEFPLGAGYVIQGWDEGVAGMKVGGQRQLIIPSDLGYGPNDFGPIPGGSTLYFDVELLDVE